MKEIKISFNEEEAKDMLISLHHTLGDLKELKKRMDHFKLLNDRVSMKIQRMDMLINKIGEGANMIV